MSTEEVVVPLPPPGQESRADRNGYRKHLDWTEIRASYAHGINSQTYGYDEYDAQMRDIREGDRIYAAKYSAAQNRRLDEK
jgi:hypothetical protein